MTPQERELVRELFDRLTQLEHQPRDAEAEQVIRDGLRRAPNAPYALAQTVLVLEETLRVANERILRLEKERGGTASARRTPAPGSTGKIPWNTGAVPAGGGERPGAFGAAGERPAGERPMGLPPSFRGARPGATGPAMGAGRAGVGPAGAGPAGQAAGGGAGGSFLGTAAAAAVGVIGGSMLMEGIRSALGGSGAQAATPEAGGEAAKSPFAEAFEKLTGGSNENGSGNDLSRQAGASDIGDGDRQGAWQEASAQDDYDDDNDGYDDYDDDDGGFFDGDEL